MKTAQDIFDELKADHDRHRKLLDQLLETHGDSAERKRLFTELTKELKGHAAAEEQALYSTMLRKPETTDITSTRKRKTTSPTSRTTSTRRM